MENFDGGSVSALATGDLGPSSNQLLHALQSGIIVLTQDLKVLFWNEWLATFTGRSRKEVEGRQLDELFPEVQQAPLLRQIQATLSLRTAMYYSAVRDGVFLSIPLKGIANPVFEHMRQSVILLPYDLDQKLVALVINDETSLRETETLLRHKVKEIETLHQSYIDIIEQQIPLIKCNSKKIITDVTTALLLLLKRSRAEIVGHELRSLFENDEGTPLATTLEELFQDLHTGSLWEGEVNLPSRTGESIWFHLQATPRNEPNGTLAEYTLILQDITDRKRIEEISVIDPLTQC